MPLTTFFLLMCQLPSITSGSSLLFPPDVIFTTDSDPAPGTRSCPFCEDSSVSRKMQALCNISLTERITAMQFPPRTKMDCDEGEWMQYRPFLPFMQGNKEGIQGQENLGTAPLKVHGTKDHYFIMSDDSLQVSW